MFCHLPGTRAVPWRIPKGEHCRLGNVFNFGISYIKTVTVLLNSMCFGRPHKHTNTGTERTIILHSFTFKETVTLLSTGRPVSRRWRCPSRVTRQASALNPERKVETRRQKDPRERQPSQMSLVQFPRRPGYSGGFRNICLYDCPPPLP